MLARWRFFIYDDMNSNNAKGSRSYHRMKERECRAIIVRKETYDALIARKQALDDAADEVSSMDEFL